MEYTIGQIFVDTYPEDVALYCNSNGTMHVEEIDIDADGNRRFQIVANAKPTEEELERERIAVQTSTEARLSALENALVEMMEGK